ncbi:ig kappa chain V-III region MOPC 63-like protein [Cricetulus griseus]|uniref:Ig kappa chain V-III region MOPC 63-like protein n=1 Tax=Cricetulus griseus TaxID=10029 RepID=A0A061HVZ8_CRIGR|nr:ig kappa chain V-III region MOPC 63-like protein [Cricetulus griseus]
MKRNQDSLPNSLIYNEFHLASGVPARFSGDSAELDFTLTIHPVEADDIATYYCQQGIESPPTALCVSAKTSWIPEY